MFIYCRNALVAQSIAHSRLPSPLPPCSTLYVLVDELLELGLLDEVFNDFFSLFPFLCIGNAVGRGDCLLAVASAT